MSAKPYTDAEIDAWRVYVAACASATEIPASARDSVRALFRLSLPSDYHARWLATLDALQARLAAAEAECRAREEVQARLIRERNAAESRVGDLERVLERLTLASETLLSSDPDMPSHADTEREHDAVTDEARALLATKSRGPEGEVRDGR